MEHENHREVLEKMLGKGDVLLCIDSRRPGVQVPKNHLNQSDLRLILNLQFRHPITLLAEGIQADLVFTGVLHHCWIPYDSLWAAFDPISGEGTLWIENLPEELQGLPESLLQGGEEGFSSSGRGTTVLSDEQKDSEEKSWEKRRRISGRGPKPVPLREDRSPRSSPAAQRFRKQPSLSVIPGGKKD